MYGWKAMIGLILPSLNGIMEPELNVMAPDGVSVHATRLFLPSGPSLDDLTKMAEGTESAAELLASARVNIIAYACTSGSLVGGAGWDKKLINRIEKATSLPATTTSTAVISACHALGVSKVALATPYDEATNQVEKEFLEAHDVEVVKMKGLDLHGQEMLKAPPDTTFNLACEVDTDEAEAVFISCTGFKTITIIEKLEQKLGKPVFSSNTTTMWDVLKKLDVTEPLKGYGKLFSN